MPEIAGISAGGMPDRVKCLHVLVGHALAAGPGVNPLGDEALALLGAWWRRALRRRRRPQHPPSGLTARATSRPETEAERMTRVAAIDCGTNSIRLLVADVTAGRHAGRRRPPDGGRPARAGRRRDRAARARGPRATFAAARDLRRRDPRAGAPSGSASSPRARPATPSNRDEFLAGVAEILGVEPEVITGDEEAALSFAGATNGLRRRRGDGAVPRRRHRRRVDRVRARRRTRSGGPLGRHRLRPDARAPPARRPADRGADRRRHRRHRRRDRPAPPRSSRSGRPARWSASPAR